MGLSLIKPRLSVLLAALVTTVSAVVLVGPAANAAVIPVSTRIHLQEIATAQVGGVHQIKGQVLGTVGSSTGYVDVGTVTAYRQLAGEAGFTPVGTVAVGQYFTMSLPAVRNGSYRFDFSGGSEVVGSNTLQYAVSSTTALGPVSRSLGLGFPAHFRGKLRVRAAVAPGFAKRRIQVQKDGTCTGAWRGAGFMKTNKRGVAVKKFRAPAGQMCWQFIVPGDANYAQGVAGIRTFKS